MYLQTQESKLPLAGRNQMAVLSMTEIWTHNNQETNPTNGHMCPAFILGHHIALSGITGVHVHVQNLLFKLFIEEDCDNMSPLVLNCSICACLHCCGHSLKTMHYCLLPFRWSYVPVLRPSHYTTFIHYWLVIPFVRINFDWVVSTNGIQEKFYWEIECWASSVLSPWSLCQITHKTSKVKS